MTSWIGSQTYLSYFLIATAVVVAVFAYSRWRIRRVRATAGTGALLLWSGAFWMICNAIEMMVIDLETATFWSRIQYIAIMFVPSLWLYLALQFTGREHEMNRTRVALLTAIYVSSVIIVMTNDYHHLFYLRSEVLVANSTAYIDHAPGPFLVIIYAFGYVQVVAGAYVLVRRLSRSPGFRYQGTIVLIGVLLSVGANILDWTRLNPIPYVKLTPLALSISVPLFVVTLVRMRRADIIPIARSTIIQSMDDPVLVMDFERRVMDMNAAAERLIRTSLDVALGQTIDTVWPEWTAQVDTVSRRPAGGTNEIRIGSESGLRIFDVRKSDLPDWHGKFVSRVVVFRDITERVQAETRLRESLREKEVLLKEIHHRVKNNLQVTASMLSLQSSVVADNGVRELFSESQNRIRAMALIHELLYRSSDLERIDLQEYITDLTAHLFQSQGIQRKGIAVTLVTEPLFVDIDTAVPCGLIVNELVSNALKHAFPNGGPGTVSIELKQDGANTDLIVRDTGIGIDPDIDFRDTASLGLQLVTSLVRQLDGQITLHSDGGTTFTVTFRNPNGVKDLVEEIPA